MSLRTSRNPARKNPKKFRTIFWTIFGATFGDDFRAPKTAIQKNGRKPFQKI